MYVCERGLTRVDVEGKQRKINTYSVSLISSVQFSSSCCHLLEIITERDQPALPLLIHCRHPLKEQQPSNSSYYYFLNTIF